MMINKRLISTVGESKKFIAANVALQWCGLAANIGLIFSISLILEKLLDKSADKDSFLWLAIVAVTAVIIRFVCSIAASRMSYLSSKTVKKTLRGKIYKKLLKLGASYNERIKTSEVIQVCVEGVEQLETYFGAYLPQFFYSMLAPLTLFGVLMFIDVPSAIVLLVCVPLIPVAIAGVQTFAKKLLSKYWDQYTTLGDTFLENLQGLTTLKIYQADAFKSVQMQVEAEKFRKITMKVLTMQLNSVTIMDLIAYGGAALGIIMAVTRYRAGHVTIAGCLVIILLCADFFIPMRLLGSYFHIAMNGMAASNKIFRLLDLPVPETGGENMEGRCSIQCVDLSFSYEENRELLRGMTMDIPYGSFCAIVGESGCGKSTLASLLMGRNKGYQGCVRMGGRELSDISEASLMENITYISHNSYLFKGSVRENLLMGDSKATDKQLWEALEKARLAAFLRSEQGLDTQILEKGANFSGGQCQRLALARALLHDSQIYIFDEATSNIDVESENDLMVLIHQLAREKTVILISHRLANVTRADKIYVLNNGCITGCGSHDELLNQHGVYEKLWNAQQHLENYKKEGDVA